MGRPRLLVIGQGGRPTGYARVMDSVLSRLAGEFECVLFAVDHRGPAAPGAPYEVRGNVLPGDRYGREQLPALLDQVRPEVVLIHHDASHHAMHREALEAYGRAAVVVYCPVDWARLTPGR